MTEADLQLVFDASGIKELTAQIAKLDASMAALIAEGNKAEKEMHDLGNASANAGQQMGGMSNAISGLGGMLASAGLAIGAAEILNLGKSAIQSAINYETLSVQFEVFLGSAEKATEVLANLNKFSIETPFTPDQVNAAGRSLLAFGFTAEQLIPTMKQVGDISAAVGKDFNELATIYGKARTAGTLYAEDINQLTEAGVPIIEELSKVMGVQADQVKKLGSEGKLHFSDLEKAFANMTSEGGRFNGMMDKMSQSTAGLMSTIEGKLQDELRAIGQAMLPTVRIIAEGFEPAFKALKEAFIEVYTPMAEAISGLGGLLSALNLGGTEGNKFANIVGTVAKVLKFLTIPAQLAWKWISFIVKGFADAVVGIRDFVANSPILMGAVDVLIAPFKMLGDAISWVSTSLGIGGEEIDATQAAYQGLLKELALVVVGMGGTAAQAKAFAQSLDVAKYASLSQADAVRAIQADFAAYIKQSNAATVSTDNFTKATGNMAKTVAGPAAGSIAYLDAQMKALQESFKQTTSQADRDMLNFKIKAIADEIEKMSGKIQPANASLGGLAAKFGAVAKAAGQAKADMAGVMEESAAARQPLFGNEINQADILNAKLGEIAKTVKGQLKSAMIDFGASSAMAIGNAIGMGASVGNVFKNMIAEMLVQIPKLTGMALLNAATNPVNSTIALPLAVAGLALLGLSGLIGGIQSKNAQEREMAANINGLAGAGGSAASGGNGRQAGPSGLGESMGGVIDITLNIDGQRLAQLQYESLKKEQLKRR